MNIPSLVTEPARLAATRRSKYLTFALGREEYGIEILKVREIVGYMHVTSVPRMPPFVEGVINLRGQIIPVLNLRARFELDAADRTERTCIVVIETDSAGRRLSTGLVVDRVLDVLEIASETIEEVPPMGPSVVADSVLGLAKVAGSVTILLDVERVVGSTERTSVARFEPMP